MNNRSAPSTLSKLPAEVCEACHQAEGVPFKVETAPVNRLFVNLRCPACKHEWEIQLPPSLDRWVLSQA